MKTLPFVGLLLLANSASAMSLSVPQIQVNRTISADYHCPGGKHFTVIYLNATNGQSFAVLPYQGGPVLLVSTLSADGVKYQGDALTWWIKGRGGTLFDARSDANQPILADCTTK
jgi:membrane-bound inhibitor of C-type lysozyme